MSSSLSILDVMWLVYSLLVMLMSYLLLNVESPFFPNPHVPASGAQPGTPVMASPPKFMRPIALFPSLSPSTMVDEEPSKSKESKLMLLWF